MYRLVLQPVDDARPRRLVYLDDAVEVLTAVPRLLAAYPDCASVAVMLGETELFVIHADELRKSA